MPNWPGDRRPGDTQQPCHVALVRFTVATTPVAIEAQHILEMSSAPTAPRVIDAAALLLASPSASPATRWLTLRDDQGPWHLGVGGDVALARLPIAEVFPLPGLVAARHSSPALCGLALHQHTLLLLFDGARLRPGECLSRDHDTG